MSKRFMTILLVAVVMTFSLADDFGGDGFDLWGQDDDGGIAPDAVATVTNTTVYTTPDGNTTTTAPDAVVDDNTTDSAAAVDDNITDSAAAVDNAPSNTTEYIALDDVDGNTTDTDPIDVDGNATAANTGPNDVVVNTTEVVPLFVDGNTAHYPVQGDGDNGDTNSSLPVVPTTKPGLGARILFNGGFATSSHRNCTDEEIHRVQAAVNEASTTLRRLRTNRRKLQSNCPTLCKGLTRNACVSLSQRCDVWYTNNDDRRSLSEEVVVEEPVIVVLDNLFFDNDDDDDEPNGIRKLDEVFGITIDDCNALKAHLYKTVLSFLGEVCLECANLFLAPASLECLAIFQ